VKPIQWITFEQGGIPVELVGERDWRRAVAKRDVRSGTLVTVYRDSEQPRVLPAEQVPELATIFAEMAPPPPPPPASPPAPSTRQSRAAAAEPAADKPARRAPTLPLGLDKDGGRGEEHDTPAGHDDSGPPAATGDGEGARSGVSAAGSPAKAIGLLLAVIVGLSTVGTCMQRSRTPRALNTSAALPVPANAMGDAMGGNSMSSLEPGEAEGPRQSAYLVRETNVRAAPLSTSSLVGRLARGEQVDGVLVAGSQGSQWLRMTSGRYAGYYVARSNLSPNARPPLDRSAAGSVEVRPGTLVFAEPDSGSAVLRRIGDWTSLEVVGRAGDMAEVSLPDGRIGYVEPASIGYGEESGEDVEQPTGTMGAAPAYVPPSPPRNDNPAPEPVAAAGYQPARFVSGSISNADYPASAIRDEAQGVTIVRIEIGTTGMVSGCSVIGSSGHAALDSTACSLIRRRFRFAPATENGKPVIGTTTRRITWSLPD
jgi:TonB family protein